VHAGKIQALNWQARVNFIMRSNMYRLLFALFASIPSNPALADFDEGVAAYQSGDLPLAAKEFRAAAEVGNADAQFNMALMYERGIGVSKDEQESIVWYRKSAEQGNSNAQFNLAVLYENGRGTAVDFAEANQWYRKAAAQGDGLAAGNLGMLYIRGQGVEQDKVAGMALLLVSVNLDNSPGNNARQNISTTRGLTLDQIQTAQALSAEMSSASNLLMPLDEFSGKGL
jgi:TPR repeat protein